MTKAEQRALEKYPTEKSVFDKYEKQRYAYICGYIQAEKDLEMTWEDVREIYTQSVLVEVDLGGLVSDERHYTEVLKRYKAQKGE